MKQLRFKVSSITNAQRGQKLLSSNGIFSSIERIQHPGSTDGCGYTITTSSDNVKAEQLLLDAGIRILEVQET